MNTEYPTTHNGHCAHAWSAASRPASCCHRGRRLPSSAAPSAQLSCLLALLTRPEQLFSSARRPIATAPIMPCVKPIWTLNRSKPSCQAHAYTSVVSAAGRGVPRCLLGSAAAMLTESCLCAVPLGCAGTNAAEEACTLAPCGGAAGSGGAALAVAEHGWQAASGLCAECLECAGTDWHRLCFSCVAADNGAQRWLRVRAAVHAAGIWRQSAAPSRGYS